MRYEADGTVQYGSRRAPVVVDPATYRGCVIVESVGDAYRILSGTTASPWSWILKDCAAPMMNGQNSSGDPHLPSCEVNQSIISGKRHGTIASINDGVAHVAFEDGAADVDVSRLRPANYDFRRHLPPGLRCEVRTGGSIYSDSGAQGAGASSITSNRTSSRTTPSWRSAVRSNRRFRNGTRP